MSCIQPLTLVDRIVPCGKCYNCKLKRINGWVLRLQEEKKIAKSAYFVTLTYENEANDKETDSARRTPGGRRTLIKRDVQDYLRSVRKLSKKHGRNNIKYYACGEYGTNTKRPHYHAIIFGATDMDLRAKWIHGFVHIGTVTTNSIAYCLKYISKGRTVPENSSDDRQKEFSLMSKRLGTTYLTAEAIKWHRELHLERGYAVRPGGYKFPLPRYLREKIFTEEQRSDIARHFEAEYILKFVDDHLEMSHEDWQKEIDFQKDQIKQSYIIMKYLSKENQKI